MDGFELGEWYEKERQWLRYRNEQKGWLSEGVIGLVCCG